MKLTDHYLKILDLDACTSPETLKSAYRSKMHEWHPDHHQQDPAKLRAATEQTREIKEAYDYLSQKLEAGESPPLQRRRRPRRKRRPGRSGFIVLGFPDSTEELFVTSFGILSVGYNKEESFLWVKFFDYSLYAFWDFPEAVFAQLMRASSLGQAANWNICHGYRATRVQ